MPEVGTIPGLLEAEAAERIIWHSAFLPVNESIAGFEVRPLTLRHYLILTLADSPLLSNRTPTPLELVAFLWIVSPNYTPHGGKAKHQFLKRCRVFIPPALPLFRTSRAIRRWKARHDAAMLEAAKVVNEARRYMDEAWQDRPPARKGAELSPDYYSVAAAYCSQFATEFGWDDEATLEKPLKRLFQYKKITTRINNPSVPMFKPSDRVIGEFSANLNQQPERN